MLSWECTSLCFELPCIQTIGFMVNKYVKNRNRFCRPFGIPFAINWMRTRRTSRPHSRFRTASFSRKLFSNIQSDLENLTMRCNRRWKRGYKSSRFKMTLGTVTKAHSDVLVNEMKLNDSYIRIEMKTCNSEWKRDRKRYNLALYLFRWWSLLRLNWTAFIQL